MTLIMAGPLIIGLCSNRRRVSIKRRRRLLEVLHIIIIIIIIINFDVDFVGVLLFLVNLQLSFSDVYQICENDQK